MMMMGCRLREREREIFQLDLSFLAGWSTRSIVYGNHCYTLYDAAGELCQGTLQEVVEIDPSLLYRDIFTAYLYFALSACGILTIQV